MTKKIKKNIGGIIAGLVLVGGAAGVAWADVEGIPFTIRTGGSTNTPCPGAYSGYAKMTNGSALWFTPPTNASSGTFTDASSFGTSYVSVACVVRRNDLMAWCGTNTVTFPATNSTQYALTAYVKNTPPPPTNGQLLNLQVTWH
jgi:hypothetical protein